MAAFERLTGSMNSGILIGSFTSRDKCHMQDQFRSKVTDAGRIVIPATYRKEFGISEGDEVLITRTDYGIQITPLHQAIRRAQELVARYIPAEVDLVGELRQFRDQDVLGN